MKRSARISSKANHWHLCSERDLIIALSGHEHGAFEELVHRYRALLVYQCKRLCAGSGCESEDLYSAVMLRVYAESPATLAGIKSLGGWLKQVALYQHIDHLRWQAGEMRRLKTYGTQLDLDLSGSRTPEQHYLSGELLTLILGAIWSLPDALRRVAEYRFIDELPSKEIALRLGISNDLARKRVQMARDRLRLALRPYVSITQPAGPMGLRGLAWHGDESPGAEMGDTDFGPLVEEAGEGGAGVMRA